MPDYRIVPAAKDDLSIIRDIAHATWPVAYKEMISAEQIEYMLRMMYELPELEKQVAKGVEFRLLVAADDTATDSYTAGPSIRYRPVGFVGFEADYLPGTTKIHKLYVLPEMHGKGYGRALIQETARLSRSAGQQRLRLDVHYTNHVIGFYEHLGFTKIERFDTDIGNGYLMEDWVMEMPL